MQKKANNSYLHNCEITSLVKMTAFKNDQQIPSDNINKTFLYVHRQNVFNLISVYSHSSFLFMS